MRLTVKLPAIVVGAILLTAVASGLVSVVIGRYALRQAALDENVHRVEIYASAVLHYVENARSLLTTTAGSPSLRGLTAPREVAARVLAHSDVFEYIALLTPDGTVIMQEPRATEERLSHRDLSFSAWFVEVRRTDRTVVSDLHISPATQRPTIVIATSVRAADGRTVGFWAGALKLGNLSAIGSVASGHSVRGSGYLTDRRGLIIAHQTRPSYVENQTDFSAVPSVSAALAAQAGSAEIFNPIEGEQKLTAYRSVPDLGWAVVYDVPTAIALAPLDALTRGTLLASLALAVLIGVGVLVSTQRIVAPLARLGVAVQTFGTGDFSQRIEVPSRDEIGQLAQGFNRMAGALAEKDADIRGHTVQLEAANKELEAFAYSVSHDLRAPLRSIDGFSQALLEDYEAKLDEGGRDSLHRVRAASQRMGLLIDDMLKLSRATRGEMESGPVDLSAMAESTADELRRTAPERHVTVSIEPGVTTRSDARLLSAVLENLLSNAWKFTGTNDAARIEFGAQKKDGELICHVRDNGAGFDMAYADNLFAPFQRLHQESEFPGNGIGLATVKRVIARLGGRVWAEGETGKGATFYFGLPDAST